ncbi:hypothetical protein P3T86_05665 [Staphylococcus nepalensis]|uniref:hypothetical protein n=1 Tax=Staphylococcus nepalensis TaxID=214473 RepID=UPI002B2644F2|nr:hypothetical protein [Staphylococcus nepalensis]WQL19487.1 hypothetical protein P3T86_09835 [Staphylococcus nepalensis]WQL21247.1 hypothetical protein P3T86_05665 [Staphylococcus nepalensis]
MTTSIAIILVALATIGNSVAIFFSERRYQQSKNGFLSDIPITQREARILNDEIDKLKDEVKYIRPLVDKHKKEQKQNHWKQYNDWKRLYESKHGRCAQCHSDNLKINTEYEYKTEWYHDWPVREIIDYPKSAEYKCNTCGEVISKWEFKEDE